MPGACAITPMGENIITSGIGQGVDCMQFSIARAVGAAAIGLGVLLARDGDASAGTAVRLAVTGIGKPRGVLLLGAYDTEASWLGPEPVVRLEVPVPPGLTDGRLDLELTLPPGRWAISIFQDLNGNRRLDTNLLGIPTEASGSSNDAPARWSAPKFADAVVTVGDAPLELSIRLD
jgi:uncharacterized protein (DUF2141 family)